MSHVPEARSQAQAAGAFDASDPCGFPALIAQYLEHLRVRNYSPRTVMNCPRLPRLLHRLGGRARAHAAKRDHQADPRPLPALALSLPQ